MKLSRISLAAIGFVLAAQAQAQVNISGATATQFNYVKVLSFLCPSADITLWKNNATTTALGNQFTVKCNSGNFGSSGQSEARFDVTGGSINSVLFTAAAAANSEAGAANGSFISSGGAGCAATDTIGTGSLLGVKLRTGCTIPAATQKSVGGFTDVEPAIFKATGVLTGSYDGLGSSTPATFSQVFGVAVSKTLYEALQTAQGLTVGSVLPAQQPTLSVAKLASLMNNDDFNSAKTLGAKFLLPSLAAATPIVYCRRPQTSGTQAAAQLYFMNNPTSTGALGGALIIHGPNLNTPGQVLTSQTFGQLTVTVGSGSGDNRTCLNSTTNYAFGVLSAENNPLALSANWRFVKVNGNALSATNAANVGTGTDTQTSNAISGDYDFVYESFLFNPLSNPLLDEMNANIQAGASSPGVFLNTLATTPESSFGRSFNSVNPYFAQN